MLKEELYCGKAKLDPAVLRDVIRELLAILDRQYGNIATVTARKFKKVNATKTEIGRALRILYNMGLLEPSGERRNIYNNRSYIIHKNSRQNLVKLITDINKHQLLSLTV